MPEALTISTLAKRSGVASKTLRYWESLGLLPRAARTHTGYRLFDSETLRYIAFIRKSKAIGLTLGEMRQILRLARTGRCPCPEVLHWTEERAKSVESQIELLSRLLQRLRRIRREWARGGYRGGKCGEVCYLTAELPETNPAKGEPQNDKALARPGCCRDDDGREQLAGDRGRRALLPARLPHLPQVRQPKTRGNQR
jgi:MerR family copper efflux transcriptional regulator